VKEIPHEGMDNAPEAQHRQARLRPLRGR
jgi:hypothetical protein